MFSRSVSIGSSLPVWSIAPSPLRDSNDVFRHRVRGAAPKWYLGARILDCVTVSARQSVHSIKIPLPKATLRPPELGRTLPGMEVLIKAAPYVFLIFEEASVAIELANDLMR